MRAGDVIAERFEIEREAGSGEMSVVFRARDQLSGKPVALKLLRASSEDSKGWRESCCRADAVRKHSPRAANRRMEEGESLSWLTFRGGPGSERRSCGRDGCDRDGARPAARTLAKYGDHPLLRESFLGNVPENARTMQLAAQWLGPGVVTRPA